MSVHLTVEDHLRIVIFCLTTVKAANPVDQSTHAARISLDASIVSGGAR